MRRKATGAPIADETGTGSYVHESWRSYLADGTWYGTYERDAEGNPITLDGAIEEARSTREFLLGQYIEAIARGQDPRFVPRPAPTEFHHVRTETITTTITTLLERVCMDDEGETK